MAIQIKTDKKTFAMWSKARTNNTNFLTLLPTGGGGGGGGELAFGPRHPTGSQNSRTLSPRVSKFSDFSFMPFGHIVAKFQAN